MTNSPHSPDPRRHGSATPKQRAFMQRHGIDSERDKEAATEAIGTYIRSRQQMSPSPAQEGFLRKRGLWRDGMTRGEAFALVGRTMVTERGG
jgi:hypothetical protein